MWDNHWWCCFIPKTLQKQPHHHHNQSLLPATQNANDTVCPRYISFSTVTGMLTSWLNRRRRRYLILILCSPFLIPLLFATCPIICALEIWYFLCQRERKEAGAEGDRRRRGEEDEEDVGLLQRYLEDQLLLVVGSVYECGDDDENVGEDEDGVDVEYFDSARPLLQ